MHNYQTLLYMHNYQTLWTIIKHYLNAFVSFLCGVALKEGWPRQTGSQEVQFYRPEMRGQRWTE